MLMIIMLSLRLMTIPGDDLYHNCRCHHSSLTDVQTAATAVTDHHTDDELVHNVNRVKWHNNCNGDEVDTIVLMKTIKTIYSAVGMSVCIHPPPGFLGSMEGLLDSFRGLLGSFHWGPM